ncbi:MAG TPA: glucose-6-phosphate isomerase [Flavobacteriaceae bacterium]|nr:glucose-6-phosphate isomerase [Flavobacteriaceae bacterium]
MSLPTINPQKTEAWKMLVSHYEEMKDVEMKDLFADENRFSNFHIRLQEMLVDFSKNRINSETMELLLKLAEEIKLKEAISAYFEGKKINKTENRAVLHTALRSSSKETFLLDGTNISEEIEASHTKMQVFSDAVINGDWKGYSGKPITDVINIGIGGSDLGPQMVVKALKHYKTRLNIHFISNVDGDHVFDILQELNPETTLCIIVSKSFSTQETLANANTAKSWFIENTAVQNIEKHFVAVSTNLSAVEKFGIDKENIFPMWDWVGGRFSLWSPVGLSICCAIGFHRFQELLKGAAVMDEHFETEKLSKNIPVILALISIWYNNFFGCETEAIIPYSQALEKLSAYLQQASMESNGKSINRNGKPVEYQTGNIIWGSTGTNAQHAFFQLIHQGTKLVPSDFIGFKKSLHGNKKHHDLLMSNFFAQTEALMKGKSEMEVRKEMEKQGKTPEEIQRLAAFKVFAGNKPTNTILIEKLTPKSLGMLIAMYEHKIFVQGIIWNVFSFDQWGVEYGKQLANRILSEWKSGHNASQEASI